MRYGVSSLPSGPTLGGMDSATPGPTTAEVDFSEGSSSASSVMRVWAGNGLGKCSGSNGGKSVAWTDRYEEPDGPCPKIAFKIIFGPEKCRRKRGGDWDLNLMNRGLSGRESDEWP